MQIAEMDFEVYSEAGFVWNGEKWRAPKGATKAGISAVGACAYSEHPSTDPLCLYYDLHDGTGPQLCIPQQMPPFPLLSYLARGGLVEAWNRGFEYWIWTNVCVPRYAWPPLNPRQLRDAMDKARAFGLPGALKNAATVSGVAEQKDKDGDRLIKLFCVPRNPTKTNPSTRTHLHERPEDAGKLFAYCAQDIRSEGAVSAVCPDLDPFETEAAVCTLLGNIRGMALDMETITAGVQILDAALEKYNRELAAITKGAVTKASEIQKLSTWLNAVHGVSVSSLDADSIDSLLSVGGLAPEAARVLEIRKLVGSAAVKKLYAMQRMASKQGRAHDLIVYHAARTGRDGGQDIQAQNLAKAGPALSWCAACGQPFGRVIPRCPHCSVPAVGTAKATPWSHEAVEEAVRVIRTGRLEEVERVFGDALLTLSGCLRGLFVAGPGKDLLCSDYSSIEAVVTAMLAGEQWRIDSFRRKEDIYLVSAGRITGRTLDEYKEYQAQTGTKHPDRQKIGKPAELGLGFGGWVGAWLQFDSSGTFSEEEIKRNIIAWRDASPAIVELWGGQVRGRPWAPDRQEMFGLEGAAIQATHYPGTEFAYRLISYVVENDVLFCRLPSGRRIAYHWPRLDRSDRWEGQLQLSFESWNTNPKAGPFGWVRMPTYGGRLTENVVQATARDIMVRHAVPRLEQAGYPLVLRVHDELVAEVSEGWGSIEEMEALMGTMPPWAEGWPVRAAGGWRGKRYRKD